MSTRLKALVMMSVAAFGLAYCAHIGRADIESDRRSLRGLRGMAVIVEELDSDDEGVATEASIQTKMELRLRREGIKVHTSNAGLAEPRAPYLYLNVNAFRLSGADAFVCTMRLEVHQTLWMVSAGKPTTAYSVRTWAATSGLYVWPADTAREKCSATIDEMLDEFVNAWLQTHPK
jgi:hypothetical protein